MLRRQNKKKRSRLIPSHTLFHDSDLRLLASYINLCQVTVVSIITVLTFTFLIVDPLNGRIHIKDEEKIKTGPIFYTVYFIPIPIIGCTTLIIENCHGPHLKVPLRRQERCSKFIYTLLV